MRKEIRRQCEHRKAGGNLSSTKSAASKTIG
jgi:hypothetical protein